MLETEIAEHKRTEANLRMSEEKYRLLFENIPVMAAVYGPDGEFILLSQATAQLLGGTPEAFQGRNMRDVLTPEDAERTIKRQAQVIEEGKAVIIEDKIRLLNGREFYYLRHILPLPDSINGNPSQVLVLTSNLTEKYLAEQRERELALAQEKNDILIDFFSTLSHDLKTPLTVISTSLYLLERAEAAQKRKEIINRIGDQVMLMNQYIQDMLTISRLEHLPLLSLQQLDLNPLIEEVIDSLNLHIEGRDLIFEFSGQPDLPAVRGDQEQLRRMLTNLIENAINYTPGGGKVIVRTYTDNGQVVLEVTDSGIGIKPDDVPHIFEPFFRTEKAKNFQTRGTGLGLPIVKKIVEMHHATIEVRSQFDEGTTFRVQFPSPLSHDSPATSG
jgi:two-component system phosphate regulon sensor histidine kinase PhoR